MNISPAFYFGGVLVALLTFIFVLILVARATKWKPKPIKPLWAVLVICGSVFLAGVVCSIAGRDIHILYWWLAGAPMTVVFFALLVGVMNVLTGWLHRKK